MKIKPEGLLRAYLEKQKNGLTGHIEKAGYPFDVVEWGMPDQILTKFGPAWWVYEQTAYWTDGFVRCGILLEDPQMLRRAKEIIYNVIDHFKKGKPGKRVRGSYQFTPRIPGRIVTDGIPQQIRLVPYGKTMARIAAFPLVKLTQDTIQVSTGQKNGAAAQ